MKAIILSFIGNSYNRSAGAVEANKNMLSRLNQSCIQTTLNLINTDKDVMLTLTNRQPATYFKELIEILAKRPLTPRQESFLSQFKNVPVKAITELFTKKVFD